MKINKKYLSLALVIPFFLTGCGGEKASNFENTRKIEEIVVDTDTQVEAALDTIENMKGEAFEEIEIKEETATKIRLDGAKIDVVGKGVNIENNVATITTAGDYYITGSLDDGQIIVDAGENNVNLVLSNAKIKSKTSSPLYIKSAKNTIIKLEDGSKNYIEDALTYSYQDANETEPDSAIFSKDDLYITGNGELNVKANFNDAIKSKDDFSILSGTIIIDSVDDGIVGKDSVSIKNGNIKINAGGDGIKSTNDESTTKGYVAIENGTFNITAQSDGIQAETDVNIANGIFNIVTGGGSEVSSNKKSQDDFSNKIKWGEWETNLDKEDTQSAKGIKAENNLTIMLGSFNINSSDDAIHCNNNIVISGGNINIDTGDDGIHADNFLSVIGGNITVGKSYEGLEASLIEIKGGEIYIVASDDGINVAGGNDNSSMDGRMGQNRFSSNTNNYLIIEGGNIFVDASGDGLDANGSIYIKGGNIEVAGPLSNGDGALDFDRECIVTGGEMIAYGSSGMSQKPSSSSTQYSIAINGDYSENDKLEIIAGEEIIYSCTLKKKCQSVIISNSKLKTDTEYSLRVNNEIVETFKLTNIVTSIGEGNRDFNGKQNGVGNSKPNSGNKDDMGKNKENKPGKLDVDEKSPRDKFMKGLQ